MIGFDKDTHALELAEQKLSRIGGDNRPKITLLHASYAELPQSVPPASADGLLADLGISSMQLSDAARGFSFQAEGPLDMRMDPRSERTADQVVNRIDERTLADVIYEFGEERRSRRISRAIVRARPISTTGHLARVVESAVPRTGRIHPATQTFMALRLRVNSELEELETMLRQAPERIAAGGRFVILTFISSEDRIVKRAFQGLARDRRATILTKHVVTPTEEELSKNPASRSAKLRALEMN